MRVVDLFSKRRDEEARSGVEEVFQYEDIPKPLRSEIKRIVNEAIGIPKYRSRHDSHSNPHYKIVEGAYCREVGLDSLSLDPYSGVMSAIESGDTDRFLDILELCCRLIDKIVRDLSVYELDRWAIDLKPDDALSEVNYRLRKAGVGYQYDSGTIIRQDSIFVHENIVKPALTLIAKPGYAGVQQEFISAHAAYREGDHETAIIQAAKSFESMMKAICSANNWEYAAGARAADLVKTLRENQFFPDYLDQSFEQLIATLKSGLPKLKNDSAAHGQRAAPRQTPDYVASYALNLAASKIVLLAEINADNKEKW